MLDAELEHAGVDGPADLVARQQLVDEALAVRVAQQRAVAPQRLGQQRPRHGRVVQRGRVELHELDVGHGHAGPQRHGDAVAGRLDRVRGDGVELAGAAGGEQHVAAAHLDVRAVLADRRDTPAHRPPSTRRSRAKVRSSTVAAVSRTAATSARSISMPVAAPPAWTMRATEWPPSRARASSPCGVDVEHGAEGDELVHAVGSLVDEHAHGVDVAQPVAGGERVGEVEVGGVGIGAAEHGGHAALGPPGRRHVEGGLGEHADPHAQARGPHRGRQAGDAGAEDEQVERLGHQLGSIAAPREVRLPACRSGRNVLSDHAAVAELVEAAFGAPTEARLVEALRDPSTYIGPT